MKKVLTCFWKWKFVLTPTLNFLIMVTCILIIAYGPEVWQNYTLLTPTENDIQSKNRDTILKIIGGGLVIWGLFLNQCRTKSLVKQVKIAQEGQVTERFTRAIDQLGSEKMEIRLGGIYALERIAKDSPKDHWTVMEILAAFVRENSPRQRKTIEKNKSKNIFDGIFEKNIEIKINEFLEKIATDIQAALTIIGRRENREIEDKEKGEIIDLNNTNLFRVELGGACFSEAYLYKVDFSISSLYRSNFSRADLCEADFSSAYLSEVDFSKAKFREADFSGAYLSGANLSETDLRGAKFSGANLSGANLSDAKNLTVEELLKVKTLYKVRNLDKELKEQLKQEKPDLFKKPKD